MIKQDMLPPVTENSPRPGYNAKSTVKNTPPIPKLQPQLFPFDAEPIQGERRRQESITKHGNPRNRHHLVEAIWRLEKWQPDYLPIKMLLVAGAGRSRKRMAVAAARRLAIDQWRIETGQCSAQSLGLVLMPAAA